MILKNRPVLVNSAGDWTVHEYAGSESVTLGENTAKQQSGIAHMFRCTVTGAIRRYGFDAYSAQGEKDPNHA
jgi:hypothetical protein